MIGMIPQVSLELSKSLVTVQMKEYGVNRKSYLAIVWLLSSFCFALRPFEAVLNVHNKNPRKQITWKGKVT